MMLLTKQIGWLLNFVHWIWKQKQQSDQRYDSSTKAQW